MVKKGYLAVAAGLLALSAASHAQVKRSWEETRAAILAKLTAEFKKAKFPAISAAIVFPNTATMEFAVGFSDATKKVALKPNDRYLSGSTGKTFFAAYALQLVGEGKLNLDAPISTYVGKEPWFSGLPNSSRLTIRHLMRHTSGIPEHVQSPEFLAAVKADPDKVWKHAELLNSTLGKPALFEPGADWSYADTNYIVLGLILEKVAGKDAYGEIQSRLLRRLGIKDTVPSFSRTIPRLVNGLQMEGSPFGPAGFVLQDGKLPFNPQLEWAGGGFASTPLDLARWMRHIADGRAFSKDLLKEALDGVASKTGPGHKYGLGLMIRPTKFGESFGHDGWFPGYMTTVQHFPKQKITICVMAGTDDRAKLGLPLQKWLELVGNEVLGG